MKEVLLKIRYEGNQILSVVESTGLTDDVAGRLELIGVIENMKVLELEKLKTQFYASQKGNLQGQPVGPGEYEIVKPEMKMDAQELIDSVINDPIFMNDNDDDSDMELMHY